MTDCLSAESAAPSSVEDGVILRAPASGQAGRAEVSGGGGHRGDSWGHPIESGGRRQQHLLRTLEGPTARAPLG